jgi:hypothetical protein
VIGPLHQWNPNELAAEFAGQTRFRMPLKTGTVTQSVSITLDTLGETLAGRVGFSPNKPVIKSCQYSGCPGSRKPCCTDLGNGCICSGANGDSLGMVVYSWCNDAIAVISRTGNLGQGPQAVSWLAGKVIGTGSAQICQQWANGNSLGMIVYAM